MILEAIVYFSVLLGITTVFAILPGVVRARFYVGLPVSWSAVALAGWSATLISQDPTGELVLSLVAVVVTLLTRLNQRRWSWIGAQLFSAVALASLMYLIYAALQ